MPVYKPLTSNPFEPHPEAKIYICEFCGSKYARLVNVCMMPKLHGNGELDKPVVGQYKMCDTCKVELGL